MSEIVKRIDEELKKVLTYERYIHTQGVVDAALYLARKYNEDSQEAEIAALMHDYAKGFSKIEALGFIQKHKVEIDEVLLEAHQLLHGKIAAHIARNEFQIDNENILNAIENHTTGRLNMSKLEKIIYLADFIEIGRTYAGVDDLRIVAEEDLDKAVLQALNNTMKYVLSIEKLLHPNTLLARNQLLIGLTR
ncbi:metal dependent phosphohydrolase [Alkaliphilus metalliredigens QYMF]|uniref:bis(5'-nucleosyl)-tetraphosphatase (symmetrical) n=1 Tax=Alkaliphilus metalliredigens (strain QYMF) TaxID=293826 RepID=A6TQJ9_ALKMQ|nr:bis(5'-nucleosyl)-tetraphosphatase (symmetrical) YqeK [Alkaliphilus metalliredigens]ABR48467.1 metal dependent phosphohydrolase [Alkaliphilus metalliredigens QYMF]